MGYFSYSNAIRKTKKCVICGQEFITSHPTKKTCSDSCSLQLEQKTFKEANKRTVMYNRKRK